MASWSWRKPRLVAVSCLALGAVQLGFSLVAVEASPTANTSAGRMASSTEGADLVTTEWRSFGNDDANSKYSPLSQVDASNFRDLEIAWRWESISRQVSEVETGVKPGQFKAVPLVVDGLMFVATEISQVAALDATTGELVWEYDPQAWKAGRPANVGFQHRGVAYWEDGQKGRVFITTHDRKLIALDAKSGAAVAGFGVDGVVDLLPERGESHFGRRINHRLLTHSSPPSVVRDRVIVGSIVHDGAVRKKGPPGHIRAFDARTGELSWTFHTIPQEGEYGVETWEAESWRYSGAANLWAMMAVDHELGFVYLPLATPTNDYYGGHRLGHNLFAESLVAVDATTGQRVWHFQAVHHGLWDYDFPTAPNLVDITVEGRRVKAIAQVSKQGFTYVFDRKTGEPVWPIEERPVPPSDVPGERAAATQPFPTKPPPFERQGTSVEVLNDLTPAIKAEALEIASGYRMGPLFTPPVVATDAVKGTLQLPGSGGGANWEGAAFDPSSGVLFVPSSTNITVHPLGKPDPARSDLDYIRVFGARAKRPKGLPLVKPPWGRVTAIDLNRGELLWATPNGWGPVEHEALEGLDVGMLGGGSGAPLVTSTLLFVTQKRGRGEKNSPRINVFDKKSGELLGHVPLPESPNGNPITYSAGGRQFLVVSVGGGPFFGGYSKDAEEIESDLARMLEAVGDRGGTKPELIALALPK